MASSETKRLDKPSQKDGPGATSAKPTWERALGFSDGAARGNPGPAGAGGVLIDEQSGEVLKLGRYLGETTNNVAEYEGFTMVLEAAKQKGVRELVMCTDSELLVKQVNGQYKVKAAHLVQLHARVVKLLSGFRRVAVKHVRREQNKDADHMSNRAIDERM
jgi:ribonuclease HI